MDNRQFHTLKQKILARNAVDARELEQLWRESGLSRRDFATRLGLRNRSTLTKIFRGSGKIKIGISKRLIQRILAYLLGGQEVEFVISDEPIPRGTFIVGAFRICENCGKPTKGGARSRRFCSRRCQLQQRIRK